MRLILLMTILFGLTACGGPAQERSYIISHSDEVSVVNDEEEETN